MNTCHAARTRGPISLVVYTPRCRKLARADTLDEARDLAQTFLADPRDTIGHVHLWSIREQQFIGTIRRHP